MNDDFRTLAIFIPRQIKHAFLKNNRAPDPRLSKIDRVFSGMDRAR